MTAPDKDLLDSDPALFEIVRRLVEAFFPERIYLFGSKARGTSGPDSDYDLLLVVSEMREPGYRAAQRAHSLLWGLDVAADILVLSKEEFDSRAHLKASLAGTVLREGKLLHAA